MKNKLELGSAPLGKLMVKLAIPSIVAFLINILYNVVDRIFIGHIPGDSFLIIALLRKVILLIPLALTLPLFFGVNGIIWAEPIASFSSAITSAILLFICYKKL